MALWTEDEAEGESLKREKWVHGRKLHRDRNPCPQTLNLEFQPPHATIDISAPPLSSRF
jgi:hypothetical protein